MKSNRPDFESWFYSLITCICPDSKFKNIIKLVFFLWGECDIPTSEGYCEDEETNIRDWSTFISAGYMEST